MSSSSPLVTDRNCVAKPVLLCRDRRYVDECLVHAGACSTTEIGRIAHEVYAVVGSIQPRYCIRDGQDTLPPESFVALLGFLENECSVEYCSRELLDTCEQQIRMHSDKLPSEYDHHRLLM